MQSLANHPDLVTLRNRRTDIVNKLDGSYHHDLALQLQEVDQEIAAVNKRLTAGATIIETHTDFSSSIINNEQH